MKLPLIITIILFLHLPLFTHSFLAPQQPTPILNPENSSPSASSTTLDSSSSSSVVETYDVITIGSGIGGLCCSALAAKYNLTTLCLEAHDVPGGCAHSFERYSTASQTVPFRFDSGPSLLSGMSSNNSTNPLKQVLDAIDESLVWKRYDGWMVWDMADGKRFKLTTGDQGEFERALEAKAGTESRLAFETFKREMLKDGGLSEISAYIPPFALRGGASVMASLLSRYLWKLLKIGPRGGRLLMGPFREIMDRYGLHDRFMRQWFDYLSFVLSGLPASQTQAAPVLYTLLDLHKPGAMLDYPMGGMGALSEALIRGLEKRGGKLRLNCRVRSFVLEEVNGEVHCRGVMLEDGRRILAQKGVVCNADLWAMAEMARRSLHPQNCSPVLRDAVRKIQTQASNMKYTGSFMHLHLGIPSAGLPDDLECHHSILNFDDDVIAKQNLVIISIPTVFDPGLAPEGYHIIHAYTAASEDYAEWNEFLQHPNEQQQHNMSSPPSSSESQRYNRLPNYQSLKSQRAEALWKAVETVIPDIRQRVRDEHSVVLVGTPLTHRRYNSRSFGAYGPAPSETQTIWELSGAVTPIKGLYRCGDCCFPGIGLPGVAASGTIAANTLVGVGEQMKLMGELKRDGILQ